MRLGRVLSSLAMEILIDLPSASDLDNVANTAWLNLLKTIDDRRVRLVSEGDLQANLFHEIRDLMKEYLGPCAIHAEDQWADLTLGQDVVHIEIKFAKEGSGGYKTLRNEIVRDLEKLSRSKAQHAYFAIASEVRYFFDDRSAQFIDFYAQGFKGTVVRLDSEPALTCCLFKRTSSIDYFAYGSNLSKAQMTDRVGSWQTDFRASAPNYHLTFDSRGKANILQRIGHRVYGAVYVLSQDQIRKLDEKEGVRQGIYKRFTLRITTDWGETLGVAYVRTEDTPSRPPEKDYIELILSGLTEHGYSESVVSEVCASAKEML